MKNQRARRKEVVLGGPRDPRPLLALIATLVVLAVLFSWMTQDDASTLNLGSDDLRPSAAEDARRSPGDVVQDRSPLGPSSVDTSATERPKETRRLRVLVLGAAGRPLKGQPILLVDQGGQRTWKQSDASGTAFFEHPGTGNVLVRSQGQIPTVRKVTADRESYVLRLAEGLHVDGRLLIDGNPPARSLTFSASIFQSALTSRFYHAICREAYNSDLQHIPLRCDETGQFRINGLRPGWKVRINLPDGLRMARGEKDEGRQVYYIETLRSNASVTLRTRRRTRLSGRCIDIAGRALANALVELRIATRNQFGRVFAPTAWEETHSDAEGRFALYLDESQMMAQVLVAVSWAGMELTHEIALHGPPTQTVPDFVFPASRNVRIVVTDESERPIVGASLGTPDGKLRCSTNASGAAFIPLIANHTLHLQIAVEGYTFRQVSFDDETPTEVAIRMHRASRTRLQFLREDGTAVRDQFVAMRFLESPFKHRLAFSSPVHQSVYQSIRMDTRNGLFCAATNTDQDGNIVLYDIRPGQTLKVVVPGCAGTTLLDTERVIPAGKNNELRFLLSSQAASQLGVLVRDAEGTPIPDATVAVGYASGNLGVAGYTDERGFLEIRDVALHGVHVRVGKVGFRKVTRFIENIRDLDGDLEFRLQPAARCRLVVKEADGRMMKKAHVELPWVHHPGMGPVVLKKGPGTFEIVDIGNEPCHPVIYGPGGTKRKITIRPDVDTLRIIRFD